jgi:hypothetical protein
MMTAGMFFGAGSAVGHRVVDTAANSLSGSASPAGSAGLASPAGMASSDQTAPNNHICSNWLARFQACLHEHPNQIAMCQPAYDALTQCQADARAK